MKKNLILKRKLSGSGAYLFILPAMFFYAVFVVLPIIQSFQYSVYEWNGASPVMKYVGLENYRKLLGDSIFWKALGNNLIWLAATVTIPLLLGLILATVLTSKAVRGLNFFRTVYFLPNVFSSVVVGIVWSWIYLPTNGILNVLLSQIGLGALRRPWLGDAGTALMSMQIAGSWGYFGFCMVILIAAIQGIDYTYYEAAMIDGAGVLRKFIHITIPCLRNSLTLLILNSIIGSLKVYDIIQIMTSGGPAHASEVVATYMFTTAFRLNKYGYASAISVVLFIIIGTLSIAYLRFAEKGD